MVATHRQHIAGLTLQRSADRLEGIKRDPLGLVFLEPPQGRVAHAGLFGQPIKRSALSFQ